MTVLEVRREYVRVAVSKAQSRRMEAFLRQGKCVRES